MSWVNASVVIATVWGQDRKLLARAEGAWLGHPDAEWLIVGTGTLVPTVALGDVEVALW